MVSQLGRMRFRQKLGYHFALALHWANFNKCIQYSIVYVLERLVYVPVPDEIGKVLISALFCAILYIFFSRDQSWSVCAFCAHNYTDFAQNSK